METNDGQSPISRLHLRVPWVASTDGCGLGTGGEDALHSVGARASARGHVAQGGELMRREGWIFGLPIDEQLPQVRGYAPAIRLFRLSEIGEQAGHPVGIKAIGFAMDGAGNPPCLRGTLCG